MKRSEMSRIDRLLDLTGNDRDIIRVDFDLRGIDRH